MKRINMIVNSIALGMVALFLASPVFAQKSTLAKAAALSLESAINRSGQQRMLSQRVTKAYAQLLLNVTPDRSQITLQQSVKRFDENLNLLGEFVPNQPIMETLAQLKTEWNPVAVLVSQAPTEARLKELVALTDKVLETAQKLVSLYEAQSRKVSANVINESGRQRMLSQRIAKLYMLTQTSFSNPKISNDLMVLRREFELAHQRLKTNALNDEKIKLDLASIDGQWGVFQLAIDSKPDPVMRRNVAVTSENILDIMQSVTAQYELRAAR